MPRGARPMAKSCGPWSQFRSFLAALCFAVSLVAISCAHGKERAPAHAPAAQDRLSIRVTEGGWGNACPADIEAVLNSAARELWSHFPGRTLAPIVVSHNEDNPRVLYQRGPKRRVPRATERG